MEETTQNVKQERKSQSHLSVVERNGRRGAGHGQGGGETILRNDFLFFESFHWPAKGDDLKPSRGERRE